MNWLDAPYEFHLLWWFDALIGHSFIETWARCLLLAPIGLILVGLLFEARLVPLDPRRQFIGFMPGNIFLGTAAALLLRVVQDLPDRQWYNLAVVHLVFLAVTIAVAIYITVNEIKIRFYPLGAILSPTKLYQNFMLYGGYGYIVFLSAVAGLWGIGVTIFTGTAQFETIVQYLLAFVFLGIWYKCILFDARPILINQISERRKAHEAHIDEWWLNWVVLARKIWHWLDSWFLPSK